MRDSGRAVVMSELDVSANSPVQRLKRAITIVPAIVTMSRVTGSVVICQPHFSVAVLPPFYIEGYSADREEV